MQAIQAYRPRSHTIIEAHPDVHARVNVSFFVATEHVHFMELDPSKPCNDLASNVYKRCTVSHPVIYVCLSGASITVPAMPKTSTVQWE